MVARRRKVVLESVLTWLNRAVLGGVDATTADELWLEAWREEVDADGGETSWSDEASRDGRKGRQARGDLLASCKVIAGKMGLQIRDTRPDREQGRRKEWDARLQDMLVAASGEEMGLGEGEGEAHSRAMELARNKAMEAWQLQDFRCLSELTTADGKHLSTWKDAAGSTGKEPQWFRIVEAMCKPSRGTRRLQNQWWCGAEMQERNGVGSKGRE